MQISKYAPKFNTYILSGQTKEPFHTTPTASSSGNKNEL